MLYEFSWAAFYIFSFFVAVVLGLSFFLGRRAKSAKGYFAAHGQVNWFVNGVAFAGDYLSAASFLGICGLIAFYGYDGFLYSIGYLAGWIVALFVIAEPVKRLGRYTFADALDSQFHSRGIKLAAAISTLVVSTFYLIPQMVGAGTLIKPLLGLEYYQGVLLVGITVTLIVVTAGMVSTTWVQFIKGSLLVVFCTILVGMILNRGFSTTPTSPGKVFHDFAVLSEEQVMATPGVKLVPAAGAWAKLPFVRTEDVAGHISVWHKEPDGLLSETQTISNPQKLQDGTTRVLVNGRFQGRGAGETDLLPIGSITQLPDGKTATGPLGPLAFLRIFQQSKVLLWKSQVVKENAHLDTTVYYRNEVSGAALLVPGQYFPGIKSEKLLPKFDFLSLMVALFCGTASLPHILIRYYTVKDQAAARKSTVVGITAIGFFYILTLFLGLGAMTSGSMDPTNNNMSAPLLARSFGNSLFAIISAIAFTTVLGTVSGLIMAGSGAVAHDICDNFLKIKMDDRTKVLYGKIAAVALGIAAMALGIVFQNFNVSVLVGWAFAIAASANLPALVMLLFWKRTTKQGITAAVTVGLITSVSLILSSPECYKNVYKLDPAQSLLPFSQPGLITIPLGFLVLIVVSYLTPARVRQNIATEHI
jgi:cation/acetate symporter